VKIFSRFGNILPQSSEMSLRMVVIVVMVYSCIFVT